MVNQLKLLKLRKILFLKAQESRDKPKVRREAGLAAISQVQADQLRLLIQRLKEIQISSTNFPVSQARLAHQSILPYQVQPVSIKALSTRKSFPFPQ